MGNFNDAVVADLECRFSEGEVVTWEEWYKWIDDIESGFNSHAHDGTSGGGPVLSLDNMSGIVALKARVTALEGAGYATQGYVDTAVVDMATQAWVNSLGFATEAWVALNYYDKTKYDADQLLTNAYIAGNTTAIDSNDIDITALQGRLDAIELDYATETWVSTYFYNKSLIDAQNVIFYGLIGDNEDDISGLDGRIDAIELDYATEAYVISWAGQARDDAKAYADTLVVGLATKSYVDAADGVLQGSISTNFWAIDGNMDDISALDGRLDTAEWAISDNESDISGNQGDISDLDGRVGDIEGDYTTIGDVQSWVNSNFYVKYLVNSLISSAIGDHESDCSCYDTC